MPKRKYHPRSDVRRLQEKLDKAYHQLHELENSRTLRSYHYFRRSVKNPLWGAKNIGQIPGLFKKVDFPEMFGEATAYRPSLQGDEKGSFMPYPNLKVASVGSVPDMTTYCHHLITEGTEWLRLIERGIDALLVGDLEGYESENYNKTIKKFIDSGVPIIKLFPDSKLGGVKSKSLKHYMTVDLSQYNPIGLPPDQAIKPIGQYSNNKEELYKYSAVTIEAKQFRHNHQFGLAVLNTLSSGIPVITGKNQYLSKLLPADYPFVNNQKEKEAFIDSLNKDEFSWRRVSVKYRRFVHLNYAPRQLVDEIASTLKFSVVPYEAKISAILSTRRPDLVDMALNNFKKQVYPNKELIIVLHGKDFEVDKIKNQVAKLNLQAKIIQKGDSTIFGDNLNAALDSVSGNYVTKMDDDDYYGPHCFEDLLAGYEYSRATFVGKRTNVTYLENSDKVITFSGNYEEKFVPHLPGHSFLTRTETLRSLRFGRVKRAIDSELWRRLESRGGTMYSTHCLNFIRVRHGSMHTYEIEDEDLIAHSTTKPIKGLKVEKYYS